MSEKPLFLGCHLSTSGGYLAMGRTALEIGANTFAFFTRNPRGGNAKPLVAADVSALRELMDKSGFGPLVAHAPYTMNLCSAKTETVEFARRAMAEDLERMESLPGNYYNFHPGSHVKQGADKGIELICEGLNQVLVAGQSTRVLLETMAGKGTEVGRTFEELARIIDGVGHDELLGVCLDTCHVSDGGYDIVNDLDGVLEKFDKVIGLGRLKAVHLNDSMNPLGSHKDRHQKLGEGTLGLEALTRIINHPALRELPFYLETPNDLAGYAREIAMMKEAYQG